MLTCLFWNLGGNALEGPLTAMVRQHGVDVLILAEWGGLNEAALLQAVGVFQPLPLRGCRKVRILTRFEPDLWESVRDTQDMMIRAFTPPGGSELLLAAAHLPSRLRNNSAATQAALCEDLAIEIAAAETQRRHTRTVLVGDLNLDPYDPGMVNATGLNAVMAKGVARQQARSLRGGRSYRMFFNPMWGLFGDATASPPGSYYYRTTENDCIFWHLFDQVLIRPDLIDSFDSSNLALLIEYEAGNGESVSLLSSSGIPRRSVSDHLPLLFRLNV